MQDAADSLVVQVRNGIAIAPQGFLHLLLADDRNGMGVEQVRRLQVSNEAQGFDPHGRVAVFRTAQGVDIGEISP